MGDERKTETSVAEPEAVGRSAAAGKAAGVVGDAVGTFLDRPAGGLVVAALAAVILAAPAWLFADDLRYYTLGGDECVYIADSRSWSVTEANLLKPHNTHVVPIFRLWTFALVALAGRLENLPAVIGAAAYIGLLAPMLAVGHLAARESGRTAVGLAAMAGLGLTTLVQTTVVWYAAGQALWAGAAIVLTVILAREWSLKGSGWRLGLTALAALAAPAIWSGGLVAGPAAIAYLSARSPTRPRGRAPALGLALAGVTAVALLLVLTLARRMITGTGIIWERHPELWPRLVQALLHSVQAVVEALVFGNLGLDLTTAPAQASVILLALIGIWAWSRGGPGRVNPLEASGATIVLGSYYLVYFFRGNLPFSSVRPVAWYHAIPQVGAVIFAAGWWVGLRPTVPGAPARLTWRQALGVLGLVVLLVQMQAPHVERTLIQGAPAMTASEVRQFPIPELQRLRAIYFKEHERDRQVRALARLDKAEPLIRRLGAGPVALHHVFGRVLVPGVPEYQLSSDAFRLLVLPPDDPNSSPDPVRLRAALGDLLRPESEPRPIWLDPGDPWPPR
jgi:hypothetical protein